MLGWAEGVHCRYSSGTCLVSPLGMGSESEERPEQKVFSRAGGTGVSLRNWAWRNGRRDEDLQLAYLLASWSVCGFPGVPAGVGGWDKANSLGREVGRRRL